MEKKNLVQSVGKAFQVMEAFSAEEPELILADLARRAGLDNGTTFRLLNTLTLLGYVERVGDLKRFRLSLKCLDLGFNAIARSDIRTLARPLLREIVGKDVEAASLGILDGVEVAYIERIQAGLARLGVDVRIGSRVPIHSSALGLAILSRMSEETQREVLLRKKLQSMTPNTVTNIDELMERLKLIQAKGYALSDQETVSGLRVIAAPIVDIDGTAIAGVSAAAPVFGQSLQEFEDSVSRKIVDAAKKLSRAFQASGGSGFFGSAA